MTPPARIRAAILSSIPEDLFQSEKPPPQFLYLPRAHARALDPDNMLVAGIRGAGKSLWWHALQDARQRELIAETFANRGLTANTWVSAGWGERSSDDYPDKDTLAQLCQTFEPRLIWKTVILWQLSHAKRNGSTTWSERVGWVKAHAEEAGRLFRAANEELHASGHKHLVLFDALDRTADKWEDRREILKGLLQNLLELRVSLATRAKAFVRPDMLNDPALTAFPDASKITSSQVSLDWPRTELYGLLWQYLGNAAEGGDEFRALSERGARGTWKCRGGVQVMPAALRGDEVAQRKVFELIAGPHMGRDHRRGIPYTWLPSHLADTHGQISPRSFLAAIRAAAAAEQPDEHRYALHWEAIKEGVQKASKIRVEELQEDFPWTAHAMEPLEGLTIPCSQEEIFHLWQEAAVITQIQKLPDRLPKHLDQDLRGLAKDLEELGLFLAMDDGRVNIPDVYRVGFRLRRRGGVKPVR